MLKFKDIFGNVYDSSVPYNTYGNEKPYNVYIDDERVGVCAGRSYEPTSKTIIISFKDHHGTLIFETADVQANMRNITSLPQLLAYGR